MYHVHGRKHTNAVAGKPDAVKAACPVWWGAHGKGPSPRWYLAGCLPNGDISQCFDKLDHELLLKILGESIGDGRFINLMRELLDAGYMQDWTLNQTLSGVPQGGIISPILSNILLDKLDKFVETVLIPRYTKGDKRRHSTRYNNLIANSLRNRKRGNVRRADELRRQAQKTPSKDVNDPNFRRLKYVRYADDFLLGFVGPKSEAEEIKQLLRKFLREELKLELSEEKTLLTHARSEAARFLGYEVTNMQEDEKHTASTRYGKKVKVRAINGGIRLRIPKDVLEAKCRDYTRERKAIHRAELEHENDFTIITIYQLEFRGIANYYRLAQNLHTLRRLKWLMSMSLLKTLAQKHKTTVAKVAKQYKAELVVDGKKYSVLQAIIQRQDKQPLVATWGGVSLSWDIRATVDEHTAKKRWSYSELVQRLLVGHCELCGSTEDIEVHHIHKMKNLHGHPGRPKPPWVMRMIALKRKTLVLCRKCHEDTDHGLPLRRPTIKLEEVMATRKKHRTLILESRMR